MNDSWSRGYYAAAVASASDDYAASLTQLFSYRAMREVEAFCEVAAKNVSGSNKTNSGFVVSRVKELMNPLFHAKFRKFDPSYWDGYRDAIVEANNIDAGYIDNLKKVVLKKNVDVAVECFDSFIAKMNRTAAVERRVREDFLDSDLEADVSYSDAKISQIEENISILKSIQDSLVRLADWNPKV